MKRFLTILSAAFILILTLQTESSAQYAIKGDTVYTMAGNPIVNGMVLVKDGKIERVGTQASVSIPDGYELFEAPVVTPGFIDARSVVGLSGIFNVPHDQDQLERSAPFQPELRAIDAYNAREDLVVWLRNLGVTTVHTGHAPGALASGQTMITKTWGRTIDEALVDSVTMVAFTLGPTVSSNFSNNPGTRSRAMAMLRAEFIRAQDYKKRLESDNPPSRDLRMETMVQILNHEIRVMIMANRVTEIMSALRLQREFGFDMVLEGAAEAYLVLDEIKASGVPVIIHPTMVRTRGETTNATFTTAAKLHEAGIPFVFQSGFESYVPKTRVVHFEAGIAVANGLPRMEGLRALTINAARFLGIDDRTGSLERGKDADIVLWEGDPFEYVNRVCTVFINGELASNSCR